ncbi:ABC transporter substrate-binding protein [Coriobacteriales bacterium OH1046]|nr:ABC transporter substrate-binding protein [Coriobacteriales bacterium OH1046]
MSTNLSRRAFLGTTGLMAATLAACNNGGEGGGEGGGSSAAAGSVYWLNFKPELDETLQALAGTYTESTGVPVKVVTAASGTYNQTLIAEMDKSEAPTLFVIGNAAGVKEWGDHALDLKGSAIESELSTDAYNLYDEAGKLVSMGYCYECYGIVANTDLIEKAGHSVDDIKDFASLKTVVEDIHARAAELGFDAFVATDMDDSSNWRVTGHLANLEYYYEARDAGGWTECPAELKGTYMENYKNLYDLMINNSIVEPTALATGGHDPANQFTSGQAAFFLTGSWDYTGISAAQPNVKMLPYYCGVAGEEKAGLNCGTENCWAVNANASEENQKATMDFMVWLVSDPDASAKLVEQLGIMPYKNSAPSTNGFLNDAASYTDMGCYVLDWVTTYQPNVDQYRAALVSALNAYNADQSDANWEKVRTAFVDGWATQYKAANA